MVMTSTKMTKSTMIDVPAPGARLTGWRLRGPHLGICPDGPFRLEEMVFDVQRNL
jgi:hypothetical protein